MRWIYAYFARFARTCSSKHKSNACSRKNDRLHLSFDKTILVVYRFFENMRWIYAYLNNTNKWSLYFCHRTKFRVRFAPKFL